jgi:hypothetical protein
MSRSRPAVEPRRNPHRLTEHRPHIEAALAIDPRRIGFTEVVVTAKRVILVHHRPRPRPRFSRARSAATVQQAGCAAPGRRVGKLAIELVGEQAQSALATPGFARVRTQRVRKVHSQVRTTPPHDTPAFVRRSRPHRQHSSSGSNATRTAARLRLDCGQVTRWPPRCSRREADSGRCRSGCRLDDSQRLRAVQIRVGGLSRPPGVRLRRPQRRIDFQGGLDQQMG